MAMKLSRRANNDGGRGLGREHTHAGRKTRQGAFRAATNATHACVHALVVPARGAARQRVSARRSAASVSVPAQTRANTNAAAHQERKVVRGRGSNGSGFAAARPHCGGVNGPPRAPEQPQHAGGAASAGGAAAAASPEDCVAAPASALLATCP
jgi:hypothetical protein